ncbi:MAG: LPXTG cell wall anchor domain-containing protein [Bacteroidota bacterium]
MTFKKKIFFFVLLIPAANLFAQDKPVAEISVDKKRILIGEPFLFRLQIHFPAGTPGKFAGIDSINHFEFVEEPVIDSSREKGGMTIKSVYKLTSFDSGHWLIPSFQLSKQVKTDTIGIDVVFSEFNPEQEYHDIKDIIEVRPEKKKSWWWYAAGGALLLGLLLVYWLRRKKPAPVAKQQTVVNPYEEAIEQLVKLQKNRPDSKQYHTRLADIFRLYIFRKKGILSLQKTTDDLMLQLKELKVDKEQYDKLSQSLRLGDFVKFAKYNPSDEDNNHCYNDILNSIKTIELSGS